MPEATDPNILPSSEFSELSEQAAEWAVCLSGSHVTPKQRADFETWLAQDPRHRETYEQVDALWNSVNIRKHQPHTGVKTLLGIMVLLGCFFGFPYSQWLADVRTGTGEIRRITLTDGSRITLDSDSAVDIAYDPHQRRIILHRGRLLAELGPDSSRTQRPFIVETRDGTAQALGTRYTVELTDHDSTVNVIESQVAVATRVHPYQSVTLQAGQSIRMDDGQLQQPEAASPFAASWTQARLIYQDAPLTQVIDDLSRYRNGFLKMNKQAAQLRFTGVLPTDDPAAALSILENALPIQIRQYGGWLTWIDTPT
ncbi:FecR family protein [Nitrosomonas aestuarii]|uniref:FecR family protein n=1 Tax=Nitrosomonas aestuarii TaxID=52441 RepID=A0A1I3XT31_9PROT|nr:FecR family protein [Nitrosomonas aestuarii]SFK22817.1 FecR family protein [Nitrosomonas aestuarii]